MAASDVMILLIGLPGTGKSTFTKAATGADVKISSSPYQINKTTTSCQPYTTYYKGKRFTIIDTPAIVDNATHDENFEVLVQIADQLTQMSQPYVSGAIYFHRIDNLRVTSVDMSNFRILNAICGKDFPHQVFVTSRWDRVRREDIQSCNTMNCDLEVERTKMLKNGPSIFKFLNDGKSHRAILDYFVKQVDKPDPAPPPKLQFSEQLKKYQYGKKRGRAVRKTDASKQLEAEQKKVSQGGSCCILM